MVRVSLSFCLRIYLCRKDSEKPLKPTDACFSGGRALSFFFRSLMHDRIGARRTLDPRVHLEKILLASTNRRLAQLNAQSFNDGVYICILSVFHLSLHFACLFSTQVPLFFPPLSPSFTYLMSTRAREPMSDCAYVCVSVCS